MARTRQPKKAVDPPRLQVGVALLVDIVAYSEQKTPVEVALLAKMHSALDRCPTYAKAREQKSVVAAATGDGFVLLFTVDVAAAAATALELAEAVDAENVSQPGTHLQIRMGLHMGTFDLVPDVNSKANFSGDAANIAARFCAAAKPGEIYLSAQLAEVLKNLPEFGSALEDEGVIVAKHDVRLHAYRLRTPAQKPKVEYSDRDLAQAKRILTKSKIKGQLASAQAVARRLAGLRRDLIFGCGIIGVALILHFLLEKSDPGTKLRLWAYERLQPQEPAPPAQMPVIIVDFRDHFDIGSTEQTDMTKLRRLLENIAKAGPAAIGIDLDFGVLPGGQGVYPDSNGEVVDFALGSKIPVFLGVGRGLWMSEPSQWLGEDTGPNARDASGLVAHVYAPVERSGAITLFDSIKPGGRPVPSLSGALANALQEHGGNPSGKRDAPPNGDSLFLTTKIRDEQERADGQIRRLTGETYLLNGGALQRLRNEMIEVSSPDDIQPGSTHWGQLSGAAVLVGSDNRFQDSAFVGDEHVSGIYLHALGVYTKALAPIREFTPVAQLLLAFFVTGAMLATSLGVRRIYVVRTAEVDANRLSTALTVGMAMVILIGGSLLVRIGILWTDYFLVVLLLMVHPRIEHGIERAASSFGHSVARAWNGLLFSKGKA